MEGRCPVVPHGHVLPYKIPKRSADVLEAERRAVIVAEQKRRGLSRSEAAAMIPGAEFLRQGEAAAKPRSQQTGEKNEYFKERQRTITSAAASTQSAARHEELLESQRALQATLERVAAAAEKKAQLRAEQNDRHDAHLQRLEQALGMPCRGSCSTQPLLPSDWQSALWTPQPSPLRRQKRLQVLQRILAGLPNSL